MVAYRGVGKRLNYYEKMIIAQDRRRDGRPPTEKEEVFFKKGRRFLYVTQSE
jgi:hypothetical protein